MSKTFQRLERFPRRSEPEQDLVRLVRFSSPKGDVTVRLLAPASRTRSECFAAAFRQYLLEHPDLEDPAEFEPIEVITITGLFDIEPMSSDSLLNR